MAFLFEYIIYLNIYILYIYNSKTNNDLVHTAG